MHLLNSKAHSKETTSCPETPRLSMAMPPWWCTADMEWIKRSMSISAMVLGIDSAEPLQS